MIRGFSLIELLIAFTVLTSTLVAVSLVAFGTPIMLQNAILEVNAGTRAHSVLGHAEVLGRDHFDLLERISSTTIDAYTASLFIEPVRDDAEKHLTALMAWSNVRSEQKYLSYQSILLDVAHAPSHPCDPFLTGDWSTPRVLGTYRLVPRDLLPRSISGTVFPPSAITVNGTTLAIAISSTASTTDPTLFFFDIRNPAIKPAYIESFDNASTSRTGYAALASGPETVYAANAFGGTDSAQVHVFDISDRIPRRIEMFQAPHSNAATGAHAPGSALMFRDGLLYLGLQKTASGKEFQILNAHDSASISYRGGFSVGRGVNDITTDGLYAYLATDDNSTLGAALVVIDVQNQSHPVETSSYRFPGAGYARILVRTGTRLYVGRSYAAGTSEELQILDISDPAVLTRIGGIDIGTTHTPGGVHGLVVRTFLAFILTDTSLQIWNIATPSDSHLYASVPINGTATALTCRNNILYIGSVDPDGTGRITTVTSS